MRDVDPHRADRRAPTQTDAGNAFNGNDFNAAVGVGIGLRWRSPIGPVRVDVAHGLDEPDNLVRLHLTIGPQL